MIKNGLRKVSERREYSYRVYCYEYIVGGEVVGCANVLDGDTGAYVERIDIDEPHRNKGYGTAFLRALSEKYGSIYLAPDNEDAQRLYDRLGFERYGDPYDYVDQGFGVYEI